MLAEGVQEINKPGRVGRPRRKAKSVTKSGPGLRFAEQDQGVNVLGLAYLVVPAEARPLIESQSLRPGNRVPGESESQSVSGGRDRRALQEGHTC